MDNEYKKIVSTTFTIIVLFILIYVGVYIRGNNKENNQSSIVITNFDLCIEAGGPVMESFPRQCRYDGQTFTEDVGNELSKLDLIQVSSPRPNETVKSPLVIKGQARGNWFFEASFPVMLTDWDGRIIAEGLAKPLDGYDWMTTEFVPFEATLTYTIDPDIYSLKGALILKKDNPSGLPEHDDALEMPITFGDVPIQAI